MGIPATGTATASASSSSVGNTNNQSQTQAQQQVAGATSSTSMVNQHENLLKAIKEVSTFRDKGSNAAKKGGA